MREIVELSQEPNQKYTLITDEGEEVQIVLRYSDSQIGWFIDITVGDLIINGIRLCVSPNILRNYKNLINFGLGCTSTDGAEPYFLNDFSEKRIRVFLLNESDVQEIEETFYNG